MDVYAGLFSSWLCVHVLTSTAVFHFLLGRLDLQVTSHRSQRLPKQQLPEMHRVPLEQTCLRVKVLG